MIQQPLTDDRMHMSQSLAMLSMTYDLFPESVFNADLAEFSKRFKLEGRRHGVHGCSIRHIVRADGRQRFVVFLHGKQWDYFDFSASEVGGNGMTSDIDEDDISFKPFDEKA